MTADDPAAPHDPMRPSGAGVAGDKIRAVLKYLSAEFPGDRPSHVPKGDQMADLFEVLDSHGVPRRLLVHRRFFDRWTDATALTKALGVRAVANTMRRTVDGTVELD